MEIKLINTKKVLSPTQIDLADYVINPYRGCEFGCRYCYAHKNKNLGDDFFHCLGVKINAPEILAKELRHRKVTRVLLGSTTECFQYQEAKYKITQQILKILNDHGVAYTILTKSSLIKNYLDLISANKENKIYFTLNFTDDGIIRLLEARSPSLDERLTTIREIIDKGIDLRIHIGPFIPYLCSLERILSILPKGVQEIDVELYHHTMGNFTELLSRIATYAGKALKDKIQSVYQSETNYLEFTESLRQEIKALCGKEKASFFYIVPGYNTFYNSGINYTNPIEG